MKRQSNFELLRILAMLVIVAGHFITQSALLAETTGASRLVATIMGSGPRIAVNVFLLIGCWFAVDSRVRADRLVGLYLQTALYSVSITAMMMACGLYAGMGDLVQGFLPFFGRPVWFVTAYLSLLLMVPFLNHAFKLDDAVLGRFVLVLGLVFSVAATVPSRTPFHYLGDLAWFAVVYLFVGWVKRTRGLERLPGWWLSLVLGIGGWGFLAAGLMHPMTRGVAAYWLDNLQTLPNFLIALFIFNGFRKMQLGSRRSINFAAGSTLAVYVVHQVPAFRGFEWNTLCQAGALAKASPAVLAVGVMGVSIAVFAGASFVDRLIRKPLQARLERTRPIVFLMSRLQTFIDSVGGSN